ncbi:MAG: hypothetical protein RLZZ502_1867, partial [Pseudomonadota bacterium]
SSGAGSSGEKVVIVKSGDTLGNIASRNYQAGVGIEQMLTSMYRANPDAFISNNMNLLKTGARLTIPDRASNEAVTPEIAKQEVKTHSDNWRALSGRIADQAKAASRNEKSTVASGQVSTKVSDKATAAKAADKLNVSQGNKPSANTAAENKLADKKALGESKSRQDTLNKTVDKLGSAITLQNQALAEKAAQNKKADNKTAPAKDAIAQKDTPAPAGKIGESKAAVTTTAAATPAPALATAPVATVAPVAPVAPVATPPAQTTPAASAPASATKTDNAAATSAPVVKPETATAAVTTQTVSATPSAAPTAPAKSEAPTTSPPPSSPAPEPVKAASQPPAAATPTPVNNDGAEPNLFGFLSSNPLIPASGLGILAAGLGALWWKRRRTQKDDVPELNQGAVVNTVGPDTVFGNSGVAAGKVAPLTTSQFSRSGMGNIDMGDVDPVAEAEVYIAYGRETQAEEILLEAIKQKDRPELRSKLVEVYGLMGQRDAFDREAQILRSMQAGQPDKWAASVNLISRFYPTHPLLSGHVDTESQLSSKLGQNAHEHPTGLKNEDFSEHASPGLGNKAQSNNIDFNVPEPPPNITRKEIQQLEQSSLLEPPKSTVPTLRKPMPSSLDDFAPPSQMLTLSPVKPETRIGAKARGNDNNLRRDLASLEDELSTAMKFGNLPDERFVSYDNTTIATGGAKGLSASLRASSLDLGMSQERKPGLTPVNNWSDVATKLDLAKAYEDMGDKDGAREILLEVTHEGNAEQKQAAQDMLKRLGV